jgi:hypothetical protein
MLEIASRFYLASRSPLVFRRKFCGGLSIAVEDRKERPSIDIRACGGG